MNLFKTIGSVLLVMILVSISVSAEDSVEIAGKCYCLEEGDLLFEKVSIKPKEVGHSGIYSGGGKVIDAHPINEPYDVKEQLIENSDFKHTEQFKGVKRVETTQTVRGNAVDWARTKIGCEFEYLNSSGAPNNPGDDNKWYCSELIHVAYKNLGVTLGSEIPWPTPYNGYVPPSTPWPWAIWYDGDVTSVSSKSIGSVSSTDSSQVVAI